MQHIQRIIRVMIITTITALCLTSATGFADADVSQTIPMAQGDIKSIDANLGLLCPGVTPPGETDPVSCLWGSVWLGNEPIVGAQVTITANGQNVTTVTEPTHTGQDFQPYYSLSLSSEPLNIKPLDVIEITAQYADKKLTIQYTVMPSLQRVDLVLPADESNGKPIASINWIERTNLESEGVLYIQGLGQDNDSTNIIETFEWTSDRDGFLGSSSILEVPASKLTVGTHTISFRVQDDEGEWSESDSVTIYVSPPPDPAWTMLLYLAADYNDNEQLLWSFTTTIESLQENFNNPNVRIAIQLDGPGSNDTRRMMLTPGDPVTFEEEFTGEQDMDDPDVLSDFIRWGQQQLPAENYYLAIANHGQALQGIAWDKTSGERDHGDPLASMLTVKELGLALSSPDVDPITIVHLDTCSMNLLETAYEIKDSVDILISSQWLGWDYFAYDDYINSFGSNANPENVAKEIVETYSQLAENDSFPYTLSALNLRSFDVVLVAVDSLATELVAYLENNPDQRVLIESIREKTQTFNSGTSFWSVNTSSDMYGNTPLDMYVDLLNWAQHLQKEVVVPSIQARSTDLMEELQEQFILVNKADSGALPSYLGSHFIDNIGASGLSIFYPINQRNTIFKNYIEHEIFSFTEDSIAQNWVHFLSMASEPCIEDGCVNEDSPRPVSSLSNLATPVSTPTATSTETSMVTPTNTWTPTATDTFTPTPTHTPSIDPISALDTHCHEALPSVGVQPPNCLVGLVYIDGQPVNNITVQIQSQDGRADTTQTRIRLDREKRPYYSIDLAKLEIDKSESFEVIVEYGGQSQKVTYIAQPGLQQLDLVIPSAGQSRPIANIRHQSSYILYEDETLILDGIGLPGITGTTVTGYRWYSDRQGELGGAPMLELPSDKLAIGSHTISLQVQDSLGNWSAPTDIALDVKINGEASWTILLYLSADFHNSRGMYEVFQKTLKHMAEMLKTNAIRVAVQVDGPRDDDSERWLIQNGSDPITDCANDRCEVATDDPDSLVDFIRWAQETAPSEHYYLVIADHGQGIQGTAWDTTSDLADDGIYNNSAYLTISELGDALNDPDVQPIDILHLDACSMNLLETAFELHEKIDVLISSQYLAWNYFAYDQYLPFFSDPRRTPQEIAKRIVQHYAARADSERAPFTISALDMAQAPAVFTTVNQFSDQILGLIGSGQLDEQTLITVREAVQTFDSNNDQINDSSDYYIDLFDWSTQLASILDDRELKGQALQLARNLFDFLIYNESGSHTLPHHYGGQNLDLNRANGLSIFYPMDYNTMAYAEYINHELFSFTTQSSWPDFLQAIGGTVQSSAGVELEPLPGPLGHLETEPPAMIYLPVIMR